MCEVLLAFQKCGCSFKMYRLSVYNTSVELLYEREYYIFFIRCFAKWLLVVNVLRSYLFILLFMNSLNSEYALKDVVL